VGGKATEPYRLSAFLNEERPCNVKPGAWRKQARLGGKMREVENTSEECAPLRLFSAAKIRRMP